MKHAGDLLPHVRSREAFFPSVSARVNSTIHFLVNYYKKYIVLFTTNCKFIYNKPDFIQWQYVLRLLELFYDFF